MDRFDGSACDAGRLARTDRIAETSTTGRARCSFPHPICPCSVASRRPSNRPPPFNLRSSVSPFVIPFAPYPPLSRRSGAAPEAAQVSQQIIEIAIVEPLRTIDRHQRLLLHRQLVQVRLQKPLQPFAGVHDLDRELVFVLPDAANALALSRDERHRFVARTNHVARAAKLAEKSRARAARADARKVGAELPAAAIDHVATAAIGPEETFAVSGVARLRCSRHRAERAQIRENLPDVTVVD